jgi:hypothetical protein
MILLPSYDIPKILKDLNSDAEKKRRSDEYYNAHIREGGLHEAVKCKMKELFPETGSLYNIEEYNIHEKIANKKSKAYVRPPVRKLDKDTETAALNKIYDDFNFNDCMKLMDLYKNSHRYCGVGVIRNRSFLTDGSKVDKYDFWALAPHEFVVHRDNTGMIYAWSIPLGKQGDADVWVIWSASSHIKIRTENYESFEIIPIDGNDGNINPYGVIPFVMVPLDASGKYPIPSSLPRQTVNLNASLSVYATAADMQIGQMVIKHPKEAAINSVSHGLFRAIKLPQGKENQGQAGTDVDYINPESDLSGMKDAIISRMMLVFDQNGINGTSAIKPGESFPSGFDRLLANADVQDIIEDNQDLYVRVENEVYKIIKAMNDRDNSYLFNSEKLSITFAKPKILSSDSEKLDNLAKKKALGLWEDYELLMEADPNLTEEQAKEKALRLKENQSTNQNKEQNVQQKGNLEGDPAQTSGMA